MFFRHLSSKISKYLQTREFWGLEKTGIANLGAYKRYREFGGKEQREEPRVREFREFGAASLRGITVYTHLALYDTK